MKVKTIEWFDDRFYVVKNEKGEEIYLPSSTTILGAAPKPYLAQWRGSVGNVEANRVMEEALSKGSNIHNAMEVWINGGIVIYNNPRKPSYTQSEIEEIVKDRSFIVLQDQQQMLEVWRLQKWFEEVNPIVVGTEMTVYSLENGFAGTLDLMVDIQEGKYDINGSKPLELEAGRYIADYKTGNSFDEKNYTRQVASYAIAARENGEKIKGALIIHTNDNRIKGGIEGLKTYHKNEEEIMQGFIEFMKIKEVYDLELNYQPKVFELPTILERKAKEVA